MPFTFGYNVGVVDNQRVIDDVSKIVILLIWCSIYEITIFYSSTIYFFF